jgi:hypothetical protein
MSAQQMLHKLTRKMYTSYRAGDIAIHKKCARLVIESVHDVFITIRLKHASIRRGVWPVERRSKTGG